MKDKLDLHTKTQECTFSEENIASAKAQLCGSEGQLWGMAMVWCDRRGVREAGLVAGEFAKYLKISM